MFSLIPWKRREESRSLAPRAEHPLAELRDEFDRLFDRFLGRWPAAPDEWSGPGRLWGFDMEDRDREVVIKADVPGFEVGELDVQANGQTLTIKAEQKHEAKEGNGNYREQSYRTFRRTVTLPPGTDPDKIEARYHNGVLELR